MYTASKILIAESATLSFVGYIPEFNLKLKTMHWGSLTNPRISWYAPSTDCFDTEEIVGIAMEMHGDCIVVDEMGHGV